MQYFCVNCDCATCSDCCAIDPIHKGHTFSRLEDAAVELYDTSCQHLSDEVKETDKGYTDAIRQVEHIFQDLQLVTESCSSHSSHNPLPLLQTHTACTGFDLRLQKKWKQADVIIKTDKSAKGPIAIATNLNGDIAVTSDYSPVTVYSKKGKFMHAFRDSSLAPDIAKTLCNQFIVPGEEGFNRYDCSGVLRRSTPTYDVTNQRSTPSSVTVDSTGRIIVGLRNTKHKTVSIHQPDGTLISKFQTRCSPRKLTCAPDDDLIITFSDNTLQAMDQSGHHVRIIWPPPDIISWIPMYLCCSKQGELFVGNQGYPKAVYRYVSADGEYKYADCITTMNWSPWGIALSPKEEKLLIVNYRDDLIQLFQHVQ